MFFMEEDSPLALVIREGEATKTLGHPQRFRRFLAGERDAKIRFPYTKEKLFLRPGD